MVRGSFDAWVASVFLGLILTFSQSARSPRLHKLGKNEGYHLRTRKSGIAIEGLKKLRD